MKTVSRMIRRYITAAFGMVLLVFAVNVAIFLGVVIYFGIQNQQSGTYSVGEFAGSFMESPEGVIAPGGEHTLEEWMEGRDWAMLLDDDGSILWKCGLPENLDRDYTVPEVAAFSRWYLDDYPVMIYRNDYGLLVTGLPRGSITRFKFYMDSKILDVFLSGFFPLLVLDGLMILLACLWLGWRGARPLLEVGKGIDTLAAGQPVNLPQKGLSAELAEKLNQTSAHLQKQAALIERRDNARTDWIAGVSHDIRTPLSLILGCAEQLEQDAALSPEQKRKAAMISDQSQRIRSLIEDLNLTSKLQYNAQPLRLTAVQTGPLLRQCVTDFCNSGQAERCELCFDLSDDAGQVVLHADEGLLSRAFENVLNNSARHNPDGCTITVLGKVEEGALYLTFSDDGTGYPSSVLAALQHPDEDPHPNTPHILGLHLVRQIVEAHHGEAVFDNECGAVVRIALSLA